MIQSYYASRDSIMVRVIRSFMLVEAASFIVAAAIHGGFLISGYDHREARIAETAIALVLVGGVMLSWVRPAWTRTAGLTSQGFALFWTLVGIFTIAIGVGPRTVPDVAYHIAIVAVLGWGLVITRRARIAEG
jgi:hypothetical protein